MTRLQRRSASLFYVTALILLFGAGLNARNAAGVAGDAGDDGEIRRLIDAAGDASSHSGASRVVVFDRTVADVQDSGLTYVTREVLHKVLTRAGGRALRALTFDYDPLSAKIAVREARVYRKCGAVEEIPLDRVVDYPAPARMIYWGARKVMVPVERLEAGDAIYVRIFRKGFTYALLGEDVEVVGEDVEVVGRDASDDERYAPPMRGHFYDIVQFWSGTPILEKTYTALIPADKKVQYEVYNGEMTSSVRPRGDKVEHRWSKRNIKPYKGEPNAVGASDTECKLLVSTSPDWKAKSLWFHGVNEDYGSFETTPEISAKVAELTKDCRTDDDKVHVLTHWVANEMRYSGISMGPGEGFTLHSGAMNFYDRCGVCKDKAGMLITMLRAAGFESYPAMTMAGSRIETLPADQFNHCVTLRKRGEGDYQILDPTWVPFVRELWSSAEQQQNYLPGIPEGSDLRETPISPPENHFFRIKGKSRLLACGELAGSFTLVAEGQSDARLRRAFVRGAKALWSSFVEKAMFEISPRVEILDVEQSDPYDISLPITITVRYRIPDYAVVTADGVGGADRVRFTPVVARFPFSDSTTSYFLHMNLGVKDRSTGFKTRCSRLVELEEAITLPAGYKVQTLPAQDAVNGPAASFEGGYTEEEGELIYKTRLVLEKRVYEASDYGNFCAAVKAVKEMMNNAVVLTR
jgi:hypothetical protein